MLFYVKLAKNRAFKIPVPSPKLLAKIAARSARATFKNELTKTRDLEARRVFAEKSKKIRATKTPVLSFKKLVKTKTNASSSRELVKTKTSASSSRELVKTKTNVSSFYELESTFAGLKPFKYYPFMCVDSPFYFDDQNPKLNHRIKKLYRFRAYATSFVKERNHGLPSIEFHLGLKQYVKTTNFIAFPHNFSFKKVNRWKEYYYLNRISTPPSSISVPSPKRDWFFYKNKDSFYEESIFLLESMFYKRQRRFWRSRLQGFKNRHLHLDPSFFISSMNSSGSAVGLAYEGMSTNSYHFSFLSDSSEERSSLLSPVRFFSYRHKRRLLARIRAFGFSTLFLRGRLGSSFTLSNLFLYCYSTLHYTLGRLLCFYSLLFLKMNLAFSPFTSTLLSLRPGTVGGLSLTSGLLFSKRRTLFNYYLPHVLYLSNRRNIYARKQFIFQASKPSFLKRFYPYFNNASIRVSAPREIKDLRDIYDTLVDKKLYKTWAFSRRRGKRRPRLYNKEPVLARRGAKMFFLYIFKRRAYRFLQRLLGDHLKSAIFSLRKRMAFRQIIAFMWLRLRLKAKFWRWRLPKQLRRHRRSLSWSKKKSGMRLLTMLQGLLKRKKRRSLLLKLNLNSYLRGYQRNKVGRRPPYLPAFRKSAFFLDLKFLIAKLFFLFMHLQKNTFLQDVGTAPLFQEDSSAIFFTHSIKLMHSYLFIHKRWQLWAKLRPKLLRSFERLESLRVSFLMQWIALWCYRAKLAKISYLSIKKPSHLKDPSLVLWPYIRFLGSTCTLWVGLWKMALFAQDLVHKSFSRGPITLRKRSRLKLKALLKVNLLPSRAPLLKKKMRRTNKRRQYAKGISRATPGGRYR